MRARYLTTAALLLLLSLATRAAEPPRPATADRLPIPDATLQFKSRQLVREAFRRDFAATTPADRRALARKLIDQALETNNDAPARYVLLCDARDLAAQAADLACATRAISLLSRHYEVDELPQTIAALTTAAQHAAAAPAHVAAARVALSAVYRAVADDDFPAAHRLLALAESAANKARDAALVNDCRDRARELKLLQAEFDNVRSARALLKEKRGPERNGRPPATDPDAHATIARYLCLVKHRFDEAIPHLTSSAPSPLRAAAERERAATDSLSRFDAANLWWDLAESHAGLMRHNARRHAAELYQQLLPHLTGLHRSTALARLDALEAERMAQLHLRPGLRAHIFKGPAFAELLKTRTDPTIDFEFADDPPDPLAPKDNFSIRWTGILRIPTDGRHSFTLIANTGARLWIDDKLILDGPNLTRSRKGLTTTTSLAAGLHPIKIEFWDTTGLARLKLLWQPPSATAEQTIPSAHFYHDALDD